MPLPRDHWTTTDREDHAMTADEGAATLNPDAAEGGEPPEVPAAGRRRARSNGQPATTYEYLIYLDGENVATVGEWEAEHAETTYFCTPNYKTGGGEAKRFADRIDSEDLRYIDTIDAATADKAVDLLLVPRTTTGLCRAKVVRDAHVDHVSIRFRVLTPGKVTEVPRVWEQRWALAGGGR